MNIPQLKTKLTDLESNCYKTLEKYQDGYLRNYTTTLYRLQDITVSPIINIPRTIIKGIIDKGHMELLPDHKFRLL